MSFKLILSAICLLPTLLFSQLRQDTTKKVNYLAIPIVIRSPETSWAFGLTSSATFKTTDRNDSLTRTSVVQAFGIFSLRQQNIQGLDVNIYFPKEKYILFFLAGHSYFPDRFWGIGQSTKNEDMEKYVFEQMFITPHVKKKVSKSVFVGVLGDFQNVFKVNYIDRGLFDSLSFAGKSKYHALGFGLSASYDTRNSAFWPTKGIFVQSQYCVYDKTIGSDYTFNKWITDIRIFKKVFKDHVIACQLYNYSTFGNTPYRSMGMLGGADNLRGFYQGRFSDNSMYSAIVEYRAPIYWRFSAVAFGGIGDVYHKPKDINSSTLKYSFGGGIRFAVQPKEKLNMRIDYGYSDNYNKGFYFTVSEAF